MRLLKMDSSGELSITADLLENIPAYAILSHTWGDDDDEFNFIDIRKGTGKTKPGYAKVRFCGEQARKDGIDHFWVDTCCIDKASHNELSEAINSMFHWYQQSTKCYVYLPDVTTLKRDNEGQASRQWRSSFRSSRWFTRGWTLQELLAPQTVEFFSRERELLGNKENLGGLIEEITRIPHTALSGAPLSSYQDNERLAWAADRQTKRKEDRVYCLLGLFGVHLVPIYGEGQHCWTRFKDELGKSYRSKLDVIAQSPAAQRPQYTADQVEARREKMLDSLGFAQMDSRRSTIKRAYSTTCAWFLEHPKYLKWMDPESFAEHQGFLWIHGHPGAGKSTLVKFTHANADRKAMENELVISFFFNARGDELEKSTLGMYRALLSQLLMKVPDLLDAFDGFEGKYEDEHFAWTIETLQNLLLSVVARLGRRRMKCFIDALDECDEEQIREMIIFWEDLGQAALETGGEVYTLFASRHYPAIDVRKERQMILEQQAGHSEDMAKYIRKHLRAGSGKLIDEVRNDICKMANGVFMWVVLVVDILNKEFSRGRIFAVKKRLQDIPQDLSRLFREILQRDTTNMDDLLPCLQWILFARRPLSQEEFYFAMVSGLDPETANLQKWDPDQITVDDMHRFVLNSSKGLAESTKTKNPTVQFIHESVRDFLLKDNGLCEIWPELGQDLHGRSHEQLKGCCINYFRANTAYVSMCHQPLPKASSEAGRVLRDTMRTEYPFLQYATQGMLYHADQAASQIPQESFLTSFLETSRDVNYKRWAEISNTLERYDIRRHLSSVALPYVLAENGFSRLLHTAKAIGLDISHGEGRHPYTWQAALANGHVDAFLALLPPGTSVSADDITSMESFCRNVDTRNCDDALFHALARERESFCETIVVLGGSNLQRAGRDGRDALSRAATRGFERVAKRILDSSPASEYSRCNMGKTALSYATELGNEAMTRLLLANLGIDNRGPCNRSPLSYAAGNGHTATTQLLLDHGAKTDYCDLIGRSPLSFAAANGHTAIVKLLLDYGAGVTERNPALRSPLSYAAAGGHTATLQLLLDHSDEIDTLNGMNRSHLSYAAGNGHTASVQLLLNRGASVNQRDRKNRYPLSYAVMNGHTNAVQLLLDYGAEPNEHDWDSCSVLSYAAEEGSKDILKLLIEYGADIYAKDKNLRDPLSRAAAAGREHAVALLLEKGADVYNKDALGMTALHCAAEHGRDRTVRVLLGKGACIDATDNQGRTALFWAVKAARSTVLRTLLERGADASWRDRCGKDAISLTADAGMTELLLRYGARAEAIY